MFTCENVNVYLNGIDRRVIVQRTMSDEINAPLVRGLYVLIFPGVT